MGLYKRTHDVKDAVYYVREKFGPLGRLQKSLQVRTKRAAEKRLRALRTARDQGYWAVLEAFDQGDLSIGKIHRAHCRDELEALNQRLRENRTRERLEPAIEQALEIKASEVKATTLERYREGLNHLQRFAGRTRPFKGLLSEIRDGTVETWLADQDLQDFLEESVNEVLASLLASVSNDDIEDAVPESELVPVPQIDESDTVEEVFAAFLDGQRDEETDTVPRRYHRALRVLQRFAGRTAWVDEVLTTNTVARFSIWRKEEGASGSSRANELTAVSVLTTHASRPEQGWIEQEPEISYPARKDRDRCLEHEEIRDYIDALDDRYVPFMELLLHAGLRLGEALSLRARDIREVEEGVAVTVQDNKATNDERTLLVIGRVGRMLLRKAEESDPNDRVFGHLARRSIQKAHARAREKIGREDYRLHDHRHTAVTLLADAGMPVPKIKRRLGHKHIETTMRYVSERHEASRVRQYLEEVDGSLTLPMGELDALKGDG